jgi:hypothetical protein
LFHYGLTWGGGTAVILAGVGVIVAVGTVAGRLMAIGAVLAVVVVVVVVIVVVVAAGPVAGMPIIMGVVGVVDIRHIAIGVVGVVVGVVVAVGPVAIMHIATGVVGAVGVVGVHGGSVMHCIITLRVRA